MQQKVLFSSFQRDLREGLTDGQYTETYVKRREHYVSLGYQAEVEIVEPMMKRYSAVYPSEM